MPIECLVEDITTLPVDAIVNAANQTLLGGGGVDGAIHRAAGPALLDACRAIPEVGPGVRCRPGEAVITDACALPSRFIIHTVGPVWAGGAAGEDDTLASCYRHCLRLAEEHALTSVAFPAISTGAFGFPRERAAQIGVEQMRRALGVRPSLRLIACCFDRSALADYQRLL